jgi:hypothetical protein
MNQITPDTVEHTERFNHENFAVQSHLSASWRRGAKADR